MRYGYGLGIADPLPRAGAAFTPTDLTGLALWVKGDAGAYQTAGGAAATADADPVGQWRDQSGSGNHLAQATAGKRPRLKTGRLSSKAGILLDGSDDFLATSGAILGGSQSYTKVIVAEPTSVAEAVANLLSTAGEHALLYTTGYPQLYHGASFAVSAIQSVVGTPTIVTGLYDATANVTRGRVFQDGVLNAEEAHAAANDAALQLGAFSGILTLPGYVYEALVYNRQLTRAEHKRVHDYLCSRWGIAAPSSTTTDELLFEGDSITRGFGSSLTPGTATPGDGSYPARVMAILGSPSIYRAHNAGVDASIYGAAHDIYPSINDATRLLADDRYLNLGPPTGIVCVWCGTNDLSTNVAAATVEASIRDYCLARRSHGWKVVVLNILDRAGLLDSVDYATFTSRRNAVNTWLAANFASFADALVDVAGASQLGDCTNPTYFFDQCHLTDAGYQVVADLVAPTIQGLL